MTKHTGLEATVGNALGAAVVCALLSAGAVTPDAIRALPELPAEFAKDLPLRAPPRC